MKHHPPHHSPRQIPGRELVRALARLTAVNEALLRHLIRGEPLAPGGLDAALDKALGGVVALAELFERRPEDLLPAGSLLLEEYQRRYPS